MIIELKNSETGKIANWKLSTSNLIYDDFSYRCLAKGVLGGRVGSKVKYENIEKDMTILLKPKQIDSALGNISDGGEPGGIKALKKALQELQEEVEEYPPLPSD